MLHETVKWKLFPFSFSGRAKDWYSITVRSVEGDWNVLKEKFCLYYFHLRKIIALHMEAVSFEQREEESLGAAWVYPRLYTCNILPMALEQTVQSF